METRTGTDPERDTETAPDDESILVVEFDARGHEHVQATHESTFELTSDDWLTPAGDCIVGVEATMTPADVPRPFVDACRAGAPMTLTLRADGHEATVEGTGHPELTFTDERSMVVRTSEYTDDRTVMVGATAAAADLDRELVAALADGAALSATLRVDPRDV